MHLNPVTHSVKKLSTSPGFSSEVLSQRTTEPRKEKPSITNGVGNAMMLMLTSAIDNLNPLATLVPKITNPNPRH